MPDYNTVEWKGLEIEPWPLGWRWRFHFIRRALKMWPFFSGSSPSFCIRVRAIEQERQKDTIELVWFYVGPGQGASPEHHTLRSKVGKSVEFEIQTPHVMSSGDGAIRLWKRRLYAEDNQLKEKSEVGE